MFRIEHDYESSFTQLQKLIGFRFLQKKCKTDICILMQLKLHTNAVARLEFSKKADKLSKVVDTFQQRRFSYVQKQRHSTKKMLQVRVKKYTKNQFEAGLKKMDQLLLRFQGTDLYHLD